MRYSCRLPTFYLLLISISTPSDAKIFVWEKQHFYDIIKVYLYKNSWWRERTRGTSYGGGNASLSSRNTARATHGRLGQIPGRDWVREFTIFLPVDKGKFRSKWYLIYPNQYNFLNTSYGPWSPFCFTTCRNSHTYQLPIFCHREIDQPAVAYVLLTLKSRFDLVF